MVGLGIKVVATYLDRMKKFKKYIPFRKKVPQVAVIKLTGVIAASSSLRKGLNLQSIETHLYDAFSNKRTTAVALVLNSPGGSPVQSDLLQKRVRDLGQEFKKPVFVLCEDQNVSLNPIRAMTCHQTSNIGPE